MTTASQDAKLTELGVAVVKEYPPRGDLQQFRLTKATTFACNRCSKQKTSKLVAAENGNWDTFLCNGCYGFLLASTEGLSPPSTTLTRLVLLLSITGINSFLASSHRPWFK